MKSKYPIKRSSESKDLDTCLENILCETSFDSIKNDPKKFEEIKDD